MHVVNPPTLLASYLTFERANGEVGPEWVAQAQARSGPELDELVSAQQYLPAESIWSGQVDHETAAGGAFGREEVATVSPWVRSSRGVGFPGKMISSVREHGRVILDHPLTGNRTCSDLSVCGGPVVFLRFAGGGEPFYLLQHNFAVEALYFPLRQVMITLKDCLVPRVKLRRLFVNIFRQAARTTRYFNRTHRTWSGVLVANESPHHYFYFQVPGIFLSNSDSTPTAPRVLTLAGEDYFDVAGAFGVAGETDTYPDHDSLMAGLIEAGGFTFSVGLRLPIWQTPARFRDIDNVLRESSRAACGLELSSMAGRYDVVLWVGITAGKRAWLEELAALAMLITRMAAESSRMLVLVDGWTSANSAAPPPTMYVGDAAAMQQLETSAPANVEVVSLVGQPPTRKIALASAADFFVTSHATASMYVSRIAGRPGVTHISNVARAESIEQHVHPRSQLVPAGLVTDSELRSGHDNFRVSYSIDPASFVEFAWGVYQASKTPADQDAGTRAMHPPHSNRIGS